MTEQSYDRSEEDDREYLRATEVEDLRAAVGKLTADLAAAESALRDCIRWGCGCWRCRQARTLLARTTLAGAGSG